MYIYIFYKYLCCAYYYRSPWWKNWSQTSRRNFDETSHAYNAFKCIPRASTRLVMCREKARSMMYTGENTCTYGDAIYCNIFRCTRHSSGPTIEKRLLWRPFFFALHRCVLPPSETSRGCVQCKATEKEEKIRLPLLLTPRVRQIRMQM